MDTQHNGIDIFKDNMDTFEEVSKDTDSKVPDSMTKSQIKTINFDKVKEAYIKGMRLTNTPCSNDALYITKDGEYYFIEFKNGKMTRDKVFNVYNKIYDSLLIFNDIVGQNISFCRDKVNFILVYNESKNPNEDMGQEENPRIKIGKHFSKKAKKQFVRFDLNRYKKIYFKDVYTYTEKEFEEEFLQYIC